MHDTMIQGFQISPQQQRLWSLIHQERQLATIVQSAIGIEGALDQGRLREALAQVVAQQEILRTSFRLLPGMPAPLQVVGEPEIAWEEPCDLSGIDQDAALDQLFEQGARRPIDAEHSPTLHASLVRLNQQQHVLLLRMPALCADRYSLSRLTAQIARAYAQEACDEPVQYVVVSDWLNDLLQSEDAEAGKKHWRQRYRPATPESRLPFRHEQCRATGDPRPAGVALQIRPAQVERIEQALGASQGTLAAFLLTCWQILLHRLTGGAEIVVGAAFDGHSDEELAETLGPLTNYLPVATPLSAGVTFSAALQRMAQELETAAGWHECFSWQDMAGVQQVGDRAAALPYCFDFQDHTEHYSAGGISFSNVRQQVAGEAWDLKLSCTRSQSGLTASFEYAAELFAQEDIERLARRFNTLLKAAAASPQSRLDRLPVIDDEERYELLTRLNPPEERLQREQCLPELFAQQVARAPQQTALVLEQQELSYAQLNERVDALALHLRALGVGPEVCVVVYLERSVEMVVGLLAVLKAGGVYVPLDPASPQQRRELILEQVRPRVILTQQRLQESLQPGATHVLALDGELTAPAVQAPAQSVAIAPESIAYVIFTSGSTGQPKGVMVPHAALAAHCLAAAAHYAYTPDDRVLQFAVLHFDAALEQLLVPLLAGATLVLRGPQLWDAQAFAALLAQQRLSVINLPPAYAHQLIHSWRQHASAPSAPQLRLLILGGEAPQPETLRGWRQLFGPQLRLLNAYGPTEAVITATTADAPADAPIAAVPIGRPLGPRRAYVHDAHGTLLPRGVVGELWLGGACLARGYLGQPALTAQQFVPDPWSDQPGARCYRSGDLVRWDAAGALVFVGRADQQIKLRGFRIELGEIEAALSMHPAVSTALVLAHETADDPGEKRLVGYIVPAREQDAAPAKLREFLIQRLPDYMVPAEFVLLDELPMTSSGKVDRRALPAPEALNAATQQTYLAPRTPVEEALVEIWSDVFGLERVGILENFFNIGGHSLIATQLVARIRAVLHADISLRTLLNNPTIASLAQLVEQELRNASGPATPPPAPLARDRDQWPLSFAQQRLWFLQAFEPESPAYNMPGRIRILGALDDTALARSLQEIVRRHDVLRATFKVVEGQPVQLIGPAGSWELPKQDLRDLSPMAREALLEQLAATEAALPFDLERGPLLRTQLLQVDDAEHVLLLTMHHIISDAWSVNVLVQELGQLYEALSAGRPSPLPELLLQYVDVASWQRQWLQDQALDDQLAYWQQHLAGAPALLALPTDRPRPALQSFHGASRHFRLPAVLSERLKELSRQEGTTLFMTLLAAFQVLLYRYTGQRDIVVGSPIAGRSHAETEALLGCFINTLALRVDLSGSPSFRDLLGRVRETTLGAYANQDLPFEKLVEELQPQRALSHSPLFQVLFSLQHRPATSLALSHLELQFSPVENHTTKFDLSLLMVADDALGGTLEYNTDLFDARTIERLLAHFTTLLEQLTSIGLDLPIAAIALLGDEERQQLLRWNDTKTPYPAGATLHELIQQQAARTPDAIALAYEEMTLSYQALERQSNQLAHHLRQLGVGPDTPVGICLDRSLELVVALLAALKAGGAYLPLDPGYPAERLGAILADARPPVVLTRAERGAQLLAGSARVLDLDDQALLDSLAVQPATPPCDVASPASAIYIIYTSGSTGVPKGVINTHAGLVNRLTWMQQRYQLTPRDCVLQKTPFTFDVSAWEFFWPLLTGARLVLARPGDHQDPAALAALIEQEQITTLHFVPSMLQVFLETAELAHCASLRTIICSGEALSVPVQQRCLALLPQAALHNLYGPTEAAIDVTAWACLPDEAQASVPIGSPIANASAYVLDERLELAPLGVPGQLYLGGVGLARGYLNRPTLTAERFIPNPFTLQPGTRLYKTGDLARWRADGQLEFLGRLDQQVKLRGFRIELEEIEAALEGHPAVAQSTVLLREDAPGDQRLVAYVVPRGPGDIAMSTLAGELQERLRSRLPDYMLPSAFVSLEALPLTANGKLDRSALPMPGADRSLLGVQFVAPRSQLEQQLAQIWAAVLGVEQVGVYDNFFDLGGHSLKAVQVLARINQALGLTVPLQTLFRSPTVAELAQMARQAQGRDDGRPAITPIPRQKRRLAHAASSGSERQEPGEDAGPS